MARETFPYSYTSPYIHLWIFETLWVIIFWVWVLTHPTPPLHDPPHPFMTHPTPPQFIQHFMSDSNSENNNL